MPVGDGMTEGIAARVPVLALASMLLLGCGRGFGVEVTVELVGISIPDTVAVTIDAYLDDTDANREERRFVQFPGPGFFAVPGDSNRFVVLGTNRTERIDIAADAVVGGITVGFDSGSVLREGGGIVSLVLALSPGGPDAATDGGLDALTADGSTDSGGSDGGGSDASGGDAGGSDSSIVTGSCTTGAVITVTTLDDELDDPGAMSISDVGGAGDVSLREAIVIANNTPGGDVIVFGIAEFPVSPPTVMFIGAGSAGSNPLPPLGNATCIDGDWRVLLNGSTLGTGNGLTLSGNGSEVSHLTILEFPGSGVMVTGSSNHIHDIWIGVTPGNNTLGNLGDGVTITSGGSDNTVGPLARIAANGGNGVYISGGTNNEIIGSLIGTTPMNLVAGNLDQGIRIEGGATGTRVGGLAPVDGNTIVLNGSDGVAIIGTATTGTLIANNFIGTLDVGFAANFANSGHGVTITESPGNTIGPGNVIGYNDGDGVYVSGMLADNNTITENRIALNVQQAIDLDMGGNDNVDTPIIMFVDPGLGSITGQDGGLSPANSVVEVFGSSGADSAWCYIGSTTTDAGGGWTYTGFLSTCGGGYAVTLTTPTGDTSELSSPAWP